MAEASCRPFKPRMHQKTISPSTARRLAITRQRLAGPRPPADRQGIMELFGDLGCVQIDPIRAVERTQLLVLWSRLGGYDPGNLEDLLYGERRLFEYWAHAASIVMTEDFPIYWRHMRDWASGDRPWAKRARMWMDQNGAMRADVLDKLACNGPLASKDFQDLSNAEWVSTGWTNGQNVRIMLNYLWEQGQILVSHRRGLTKFWNLRERCLPQRTPREDLEWSEVVYRAAQKALRALGVGHLEHIRNHFTRNNYPGLEEVLDQLEVDGHIIRVQVANEEGPWPGPWYVHALDLSLLEKLEAGGWQPRTTLLSPFDNLICDRDRTAQLFGFDFRIEIYVPKAKRQYGYYVLPILHGDRLIGRIDPQMDRKNHTLTIHAVFAEPDVPMNAATGRAVRTAIEELAAFLGAKSIVYEDNVPDGWQAFLR